MPESIFVMQSRIGKIGEAFVSSQLGKFNDVTENPEYFEAVVDFIEMENRSPVWHEVKTDLDTFCFVPSSHYKNRRENVEELYFHVGHHITNDASTLNCDMGTGCLFIETNGWYALLKQRRLQANDPKRYLWFYLVSYPECIVSNDAPWLNNICLRIEDTKLIEIFEARQHNYKEARSGEIGKLMPVKDILRSSSLYVDKVREAECIPVLMENAHGLLLRVAAISLYRNKYIGTLSMNINRLNEILEGKACPYLHNLFTRRGRMGYKLQGLHTILSSRDGMEDIGGELFTEVPLRELSENYGGSLGTWSHYIALLTVFGLVKKRRPGEYNENTETERRLWIFCTNNALETPARYYIPQYDDQILAEAERMAKIFVDGRYPLSGMCKSLIRKVYGSEAADMAYCDERTYSPEEQRAFRIINRIVEDAITAQGYIFKNDIVVTLAREARIPVRSANTRWQTRKNNLLFDNGLECREPNRDEKVRLGIDSNNRQHAVFAPIE